MAKLSWLSLAISTVNGEKETFLDSYSSDPFHVISKINHDLEAPTHSLS